MADPGVETRIVDIKGRQVVVRQLTDMQMMLMVREMKVAQDPESTNMRKLHGIASCYDILESAIVQEEDRQFLVEQVKSRQVELKDMMEIFSAFQAPEKPAVRRGRTSRAHS